MPELAHERLDVYQAAVDFLVLSEEVAASLHKGRAYIADQLRRASLPILLNVAEGAGEFAVADKARFYRMARRSGTEAAAILDGCRPLRIAEEAKVARGRELVHRVVAMLTAMVLKMREPGTGAGAGAGTGRRG
jgi:four helix bundle protein